MPDNRNRSTQSVDRKRERHTPMAAWANAFFAVSVAISVVFAVAIFSLVRISQHAPPSDADGFAPFHTSPDDSIPAPSHAASDDSIPAPSYTDSSICSSSTPAVTLSDWRELISLLELNGFNTFAVGINTVLDVLIRARPELISATVFVSKYPEFENFPEVLLAQIVRYHIVEGMYTSSELALLAEEALLPEKALLQTLNPTKYLEITLNASTQALAIGGVVVTRPNLFVTNVFVVHSISRSLVDWV